MPASSCRMERRWERYGDAADLRIIPPSCGISGRNTGWRPPAIRPIWESGEALFRRFDDVIEMALPGKIERKRLLEMTLSAIPTSPDINLDSIAEQMDGFSAANVVLIAQRAAKISILSGNKKVCYEHFSKALKESLKF